MKSHVWHAGMHPKMPIQIYFIKFLGHPILKFYGTAMILDDIMIILAPRCDISKIFVYKFCSEMSVNFKLCHIHKTYAQNYRIYILTNIIPEIDNSYSKLSLKSSLYSKHLTGCNSGRI